MEPILVSGAIELASRISSALSGGGVIGTAGTLMANKSLVDVASVARVEPIVMVDADCVHIEAIGDVMQTVQSMFAGYYLQAINMMATVGGVSVASKLAPLNPNRALGFEHMITEGRKAVAMEAYAHRLPMRHHSNEIAMEEAKSVTSDKVLDSVKEAAVLSIGKIYNVTLKQDGAEVTMPIAIRMMVNIIPTRRMVEMFTYQDTFDMDMKERYHAWKAGRLEFVKDLILCNDLIDKRRRAGIKDANGLLSVIAGREAKNIASSLKSGNASVATSSNIAILSSETLEQVEMELNGSISNSKVRKTIFENTNLMLLVVIDKAWERVVIYTRGLDSTTNLSFRDLKANSKSGPDAMDILKAYTNGTSI